MDIHASRKAVEELNALYAEMNGYKIEPPKEKLKTDRNMFNIPKSEQDAARERIKAKTAAKRAKMSEGVRDEDPEKGTAERKARLEKKRGMKLDDHPQYKKEEVEQVDENRAAMGRINKEYHRKKEAEAMAARARDPKVKRDLPKRKNDNPMYDPKSAGSSRVKGFKFTGEEVEHIDEIIDPKGAARMDAAKKKKKVDVFAYDRKLQAQGKLKGKKLPPAPTNEALDPVGKEDGDVNNDGKKDSTDSYLMNRRKAIGKAMGKKMKKESFSDWRSELIEVIDKEEQDKQIKEKNVKNKVTIDPELKLEQVAEELGGELLEWIELDEASYEEIAANKRYKSADHMGEGLSIDDQMRISREAAKNRKPFDPEARQKQRAAQLRNIAKNAKKDTRTDAQKMTDATGPRPGSRYRGD